MSELGESGGPETVPKSWRRRFFEALAPDDVFCSRLGRTITGADNVWFTLFTNQGLRGNTLWVEATRSNYEARALTRRSESNRGLPRRGLISTAMWRSSFCERS